MIRFLEGNEIGLVVGGKFGSLRSIGFTLIGLIATVSVIYGAQHLYHKYYKIFNDITNNMRLDGEKGTTLPIND